MNVQRFLWLAIAVIFASSSEASDWSTYRASAARTGFVEGDLPAKPTLRWMHHAPHAPQPAWPRSERMRFDRAFHTVVSSGNVFFGSSVDGAIHALDLSSGQHQWSYHTGGPIRFAPVVWQDQVIAASDDGYLYALSAKSGEVIWKKRGGPDHRSILGNQRLISKWPARGGPALMGDVVYFAAGIWPSDGIYLYALEAKTGKEIWRNEDSGDIYMPQPHGGASAKSGVSAQGYLVASGDHLFVPTGRAVPAAFDRLTGKFKYFHLQKYGHNGGAPTMAIGDMFFNSGLTFDAGSGEKLSSLKNGPIAATRDGIAQAEAGGVALYNWQEVVKPDRKGKQVKSKGLKLLGKVADAASGAALIVVGDKVVSGADGRVEIIDVAQKKVVAAMKVDGVAYGLAVSDGNLIVSTDRGGIYCYGNPGPSVTKSAESFDEPAFPHSKLFKNAAKEVLAQSDANSGYCLDLGCGDGNLAYELAKQTRLRIYAVEDTLEKVELARRNLINAGVYGSRVTVHLRDLTNTGYPKYFANLVVSGRSVLAENVEDLGKEIGRLQRPYGGVACLGPPGEMNTSVREALEGAGSWSHQYANAANTLNSGDALVEGRLGMLWFRDVDIDVPQRHGRAPAPLFHRGLLLHQGMNGVVAVDSYNGHELWRYDVKGLLSAYNGDELMGTAGTGSNFCVHDNSLYVRNGQRCLKLDATTGTLQKEFQTPKSASGEPGVWGYVACVDGVLYGSVANQEHIVTYRYRPTTGDMKRLLTESKSLFAIDAESGKPLWHYQAKDSIRHNAIAIAEGSVYLIDRPLSLSDREKRPKEKKKHELGRLLALDAKTGEEKWTEDKEIYGTLLAVSEEHDAVLMSYQPTRFRLDSEVGGRMAAFRAGDGERLWDNEVKYESRPMINGSTVYAQGGAWDLLTGESRPFNFKRSYGCGILASSKNMMLFRSATLGYFDIETQKQTDNFGGIRPGCWVNVIPAGGVVLVPDASAGCRCSYLNRAWFALQGEPE